MTECASTIRRPSKRLDARSGAVFFAATLAACLGPSGLETPPSDDAGTPDAGQAPTHDLPSLVPCPAGWTQTPDGSEPGVAACEPGAPGDCGPDEAMFPGDAACARVGSACPAGDFADELPPGRAIFVRAGAPAGGSGTAASPYGTIAEALAVADAGDVVALSQGTFDEVVDVREAVTIWGACVSGTTLAVSTPLISEATISFWSTSSGAKLGNLGISGERVGVSVQRNRDPVEIESVVVSQALATGIVLFGDGSLVGRDLVVRETRPYSGGFGSGIEVSEGASLELHRAVVEDCSTVGMLAGDAGTVIDAEDVAIRRTRARPSDDDQGNGFALATGASATLRRVVLEGNATSALSASDPGTNVTVEDLVARDTRAREMDGELGFGLNVFDGATIDVTRALVERNEGLGLQVAGAGTVLTGRDVVVRDTQGFAEGGLGGYGLQGREGASITLSRAAFLRNRSANALIAEAGTTATLEDFLVAGTLESRCADTTCPDTAWGVGVESAEGAQVAVTRFQISDSALCGVQIVLDAGLDLHAGEVSHNPIGANVQIDSYDVERLRDGVLYVDNESALDSTALPVPDAIAGL